MELVPPRLPPSELTETLANKANATMAISPFWLVGRRLPNRVATDFRKVKIFFSKYLTLLPSCTIVLLY